METCFSYVRVSGQGQDLCCYCCNHPIVFVLRHIITHVSETSDGKSNRTDGWEHLGSCLVENAIEKWLGFENKYHFLKLNEIIGKKVSSQWESVWKSIINNLETA